MKCCRHLKDVSQERIRFSHFQPCRLSREVSHESFAFSHLQLSDFEGCLARKLRFHIFNVQILRQSRTKVLCFAGSSACLGRLCEGKSCPAESFVFTSFSLGSESLKDRPRSGSSHFSQASASLDFEGCLARKLCFHSLQLADFERCLRTKASFSHLPAFQTLSDRKTRTKASLCHIFSFQTLRDVSHESSMFET